MTEPVVGINTGNSYKVDSSGNIVVDKNTMSASLFELAKQCDGNNNHFLEGKEILKFIEKLQKVQPQDYEELIQEAGDRYEYGQTYNEDGQITRRSFIFKKQVDNFQEGQHFYARYKNGELSRVSFMLNNDKRLLMDVENMCMVIIGPDKNGDMVRGDIVPLQQYDIDILKNMIDPKDKQSENILQRFINWLRNPFG